MYRAFRLTLIAAAILIGIPAALVALYRVVPPPLTPLMVLRTLGYEATPKLPPTAGWHYRWVPLTAIAPSLPRAVIAAEDATFCSHHGFELKSFNRAWELYREGRATRGGSTLTQQAAKNAYLWPGRNAFRKIVETGFTPLLELIWGKRRIMEIYLNIVEWAPGVYGAEAAAEYHFHKHAAALTSRESALLASVLPSPRHWSASKPGPYVQNRATIVAERAQQVVTSCLGLARDD